MRKAAALFLAFILLNSIPSAALAQATAAASPTAFECETNRLSEEESQKILNLLRDGFLGDKITGNTAANPERDELAAKNIILTDPEDSNVSEKTEVPNKKFDPWEMSQFLNSYVKGPFAMGVVLDDSLRMGRCAKYDANCAMLGANLKYRNSGAGVKASIKNVWNDATTKLRSFWDGNANLPKLSEEENEYLRARFQNEDKNSFDMKVVERLEKELIPNSIMVTNFESTMRTNCTNPGCLLSSYSMFDKYFNSYLSLEMVLTNFGPTLWHSAKKLFGWSGKRWTFLKGIGDKWGDEFRRRFENLDTAWGRYKMQRMHAKIDKYPDFRKFYNALTSGDPKEETYLMQTANFQAWWGDVSASGGMLDKFDTQEKQAAFVSAMKDLKTLIRAGEANLEVAQDTYKNVAGAYGDYSPQAQHALVNYGRATARWMNQLDNDIRLDEPWRFLNMNFSQLYDKGVMNLSTGEVMNLNDDPRHFRVILEKFVDDGDWRGFENQIPKYDSVYQTVKAAGVDTGGIQLYGFDAATAQEYRALSYANIERGAKDIKNLWIETDYGEHIRFNPNNAKLIMSRLAGNAKVVAGNWAPTGALTPEGLAERLTNARHRRNLANMTNNMDQILDTAREKNWVSRRYWSALDKLTAQENEFMRSYFSLKGGIKWTAYPFGYWWAKKGLGIKGLSMYQMPNEWKDITIHLGEEAVYGDAYIDFFANEGSDQGDAFVKMLNNMPWKIVYDAASELYAPARNMLNKLTRNELRNEVEDLAFYLTTPNNCPTCTIVIRSEKMEDFSPFFSSNQTLDSYIVEDTRTKKAKDDGQLLIAYAHHANLKGKSEGVEGGKIDLAEAKREKKTCTEVIENELKFWGMNYGKLLPEGPAAAGVLYGIEALSYASFYWSGIFTTALMQTVVAPKLRDCVDYEEGYFVHYFVPTEKEENKQKDLPEISTEKVGNFISDMKNRLIGPFTSDSNSATRGAVEKAGEEIDKFVKNAAENNIAQARLSAIGQSTGQLTSRKLFYFWCGEGCEVHAAAYKTKGKEIIGDSNRGIALELDYNAGTLSQNGTPIITNPDAVRMASLDLRIPAEELPKTLTTVCISDSNETAIEINSRGEALVLDEQLLGCIQQGALEQTGIGFTGNNLYDTFGRVEVVVTDTHPQIMIMDDKIVAEGMPRKIAEGKDEKITIKSNREVELSKSNDGLPQAGVLRSVQFKNGSIVVKDNGCFIVWLRHNEKGIMNQNDVKGLNTELTSSTNPETGCEEPAVNFEVEGDPDSPYSIQKAEEFNKALAHVGPFQVFETPTKRYVLYMDEDCKEHLRIIDKETGEITDLVGNATETPTGLKFITDDGKEHTLDIGQKDGVPYVQFDGGKPETLTSAQGRNGAFWYDPEKGLWYAENGQLLPLLEAFRKGMGTQVGPNGDVTTTVTGNNVLNLQVGADGKNLLNLPSLPEDNAMQLLFIILMVASFVITRMKCLGKSREGSPRLGSLLIRDSKDEMPKPGCHR